MMASLTLICAPWIALFVNALFQLGAGRWTGDFSRSVLVGLLSGLAALAGMEWIGIIRFGEGSVSVSLLVDLPAYLVLSYCYLCFLNLGNTSIRVRLFVELSLANGGIARADLVARYDENAILRLRVERLVEGGHLRWEGDRLLVGKSVLIHISNVVFFCKRILLHRDSEFDV